MEEMYLRMGNEYYKEYIYIYIYMVMQYITIPEFLILISTMYQGSILDIRTYRCFRHNR